MSETKNTVNGSVASPLSYEDACRLTIAGKVDAAIARATLGADPDADDLRRRIADLEALNAQVEGLYVDARDSRNALEAGYRDLIRVNERISRRSLEDSKDRRRLRATIDALGAEIESLKDKVVRLKSQF